MKIILLEWYNTNKKSLPWRINNNPYEIWISEIILQQTRVKQGLNYYLNFIAKFPTLEKLANASEEEVLKQWEGLGYYSRARNILFTANYIFYNLNNNFPNSFDKLLDLKGIGKYTAAAIASICFNEAVAAIDGNAFRVYARLFEMDLDISESKNFKFFFDKGNELIDSKNPGDFNQAIMDLGSTICLPKKPNCHICPFKDFCLSFKNKSMDDFPVKNKKIKVSKEEIHYLKIIDKENNFILKKRNKNSIWANMFDFPEICDFEQNTDFTLTQKIIFLFKINHILTHKKLTIFFYEVTLDNNVFSNLIASNSNYFLCDVSSLEKYPLPKPMEYFFKNSLY